MQDPDEAICLGREALVLCPQGHHHRPKSLNNLANGLSTRYKQLGPMQDLDRPLSSTEKHSNIACKDTSSINVFRQPCNSALYSVQLGAVQDLDEAIVLDHEALDLRPQGDPIGQYL